MNASSSPGKKAGRPLAGPVRSRATKRASLACVQCRSRHIKCSGELPACKNCRIEEKTCYYAESRRGKRIMRNDGASPVESEPTSNSTPSPNIPSFDLAAQVSSPLVKGWTVMEDPKTTSSSTEADLIHLYYTHFHKTHSWLPPKQTLVRLAHERKHEFHLMMSMIAYIGAVYSKTVNSKPLREKAHKMASGSLQATIWNIQSLLCISIAAFGEGEVEFCGNMFGKAVEMALFLGLQHKGFADAEKDPILAESYRRTYWALYVHGSLRTVREHHGHFQLFSTPATTEFPCEEWEYQSGDIPKPTSFADYDRTPASGGFSSWAYLSILIPICGEYVVPLLNVGKDARSEAVERADDQVLTWLSQLPEWKKKLIDPDGIVDMILFHALGIAHGLRIRIQLQLHNAGVGFRAHNLITEHSIFESTTTPLASTSITARPWLSVPTTALQASMALASLFNVQLPQERLSPSCILGIERAVLPMLDSYLYGGNRVSQLRDKINLLVQVLGKAGQFWSLSKAVSEDIESALKVSDAQFGKDGEDGCEWEQETFKEEEQADLFDWLEPYEIKQEENHIKDQSGTLALNEVWLN